MSNQLLTVTKITREALAILHNSIAFTKGVDRQYSKEFGVTGAKIGNTINIRKPNNYYVSDGNSLHVQDTQEDYTSLTLDHLFHVDVNFTTTDLALSLDDFSQRILAPAMAKLAAKIDQTGLAKAVSEVYNQVGTPGSPPGTASTGSALTLTAAPWILTNAGRVLNDYAAPQNDRSMILNPAGMANLVASMSGFYNAQSEVSKQMLNGFVTRAYGFDFFMDQNIQNITTGNQSGYSDTATEVRTAPTSTDGYKSLVTEGWTAAAGHVVMKAGEVFTVDTVYGVNPETQLSTGELQRFVVTADAITDGSGYATIAFEPAMIVIGTNVANGTVTNLPTNTCDINLMSGSASTSYPVNIAFQRQAFTLGTADLELPNGVHFAGRETYDGISLRVIRQYDINTNTIPCRIEVLCGWKTVRPEWAVKVCG